LVSLKRDSLDEKLDFAIELATLCKWNRFRFNKTIKDE
jgi:hypothetical protein